ncbi:hypothetical protein ACFLRX_10120, partial [Acidobacteriota bacterium]
SLPSVTYSKDEYVHEHEYEHEYEQEQEVEIIQEDMNGAPKVFLDCGRACDKNYIRTEISFVNYVRDRKDADVHVLVTTQGTGSGGQEYTMNFMGLNDYEGINSTLKYSSGRTATDDEERKEMAHVLKAGLIPYVARTPLLNQIKIDYSKRTKPAVVEDRWNYWVYYLSLRGSMSGQKTYSNSDLNGNVSLNRVTPASKFRMSLSANFRERVFKFDDTTISSPSEEKNFTGLWVKSLSDHWSFGGWFGASSNTFDNTKFRSYLAPALEFNIFPYGESTRRQLRVLYRIGIGYYSYREETIYEKVEEMLFSEALSITFEQKEPWGNLSGRIEGSHFFHDFSKNKLVFSGNISFRLFKGFSLSLNGRYSSIRDQLSLPKEDASLEDILLRIKQLQTNYSYSLSLGLNYSFGSIYSNVVNPRFGR